LRLGVRHLKLRVLVNGLTSLQGVGGEVMQAWRAERLGEPGEVLQRVEAEAPAAGPGELVIQVAASALALPDVMLCRGVYPLTPPLPLTPGLEFVGVVVEAGPGTTTAVGTRVMGVSAFLTGYGAFAERCKAQERAAYPVGPGMADAQAAGFTIAYHTAYVGLARRAKVAAGETVLVHGGAGGTGFAAIQLAKALGARVIATAGGADKAALCRELGADLAIDHSREDWVQAANDATGGRGVEVVFDPVGGEMFERSMDCLAVEGRLLPIGFACGRRGEVSSVLLNRKNASIVGVLGGGYPREVMAPMHAELLRLYAEGAIRMLVDRTIGFAEIPQGLQAVAERKARGRIVALH
jgi:NADPH2:quinone reductase